MMSTPSFVTFPKLDWSPLPPSRLLRSNNSVGSLELILDVAVQCCNPCLDASKRLQNFHYRLLVHVRTLSVSSGLRRKGDVFEDAVIILIYLQADSSYIDFKDLSFTGLSLRQKL
jgi:hypothetical protein